MNLKRSNKYLVTALAFGLAFHGASLFYTLEGTYDALIHLFFGSHYANDWFATWNTKWYTGFTILGYPPLVHQLIAAFSLIGGLKFGLFTVAFGSIALFITGIYRYALLLMKDRTIAGITAILAVLSSSFIETLHLFGQLPSIIGISLLMHALPEIYAWMISGKKSALVMALSLMAVMVTSHHVTPIFGMVFFVFPVIGLSIMDGAVASKQGRKVNLRSFISEFIGQFKRIVLFGSVSLVLIVICILPYWINTRNNPITQVPIPHGSRDNFLEILSSGLVFFVIPWGILLLFMPYLFYRFFQRRFLFFGLSFSLLFILGTGGTTSIPRIILGENAFNILTLDRFTLWGSILALPVFGELVYRFSAGDIKEWVQDRIGQTYHRLTGAVFAFLLLLITIFSMSLGYFRPAQPDKIDMTPLVNFLNQDEHYKWRYLPLGFGDQMA